MLDVGCGPVSFSLGFEKRCPLSASPCGEPSADHLALARRRLPHVEPIELDILEPQRRAFDVVGAFDVLEHIADDDRALRGLFDATAPGGVSILLVPQHAWLWSRTDVYARRIRRYSRRELVSKLERRGFRVTLATSFVSALLPALLAVRMFPRGAAASYELESELVPPVPVNRLLEKIFDGERLLIERGVSLEVGGSLLVVARRNPSAPSDGRFATVDVLSWDTSFFGLTIGRALVVDARDVDRALTEARAHDVACLYAVVPGAAAEPTAAAVHAGGVLTALRLELQHDGKVASVRPSTVRRAVGEDAERVAEFATLLAPASRFAQDERFPPKRIEEMYRIWALNDLRDGEVFVDTTGGRGLLALSKRPPGLAVDLLFVTGDARGTGLGGDLLESAIAEAEGSGLSVATDARNVRAVRFYESAGFRARSLEAVLHVWLDALD